MREIVLGSEGRMGILTEVKVRVTPLPEQENFHVAFAFVGGGAKLCARTQAARHWFVDAARQ